MFLLLFCLFISTLAFYNFYVKRRNLPPGPAPLPLVGNLLAISLSGSGEQMFKQWRRQYGPIFTYWIAERPVICVADYHKMVELFQRDLADHFVDRYNLPFESTLRDGQILAHGVLISSGERWRHQRRFALNFLREFGLGSNKMQERILDEMSLMFNKIDGQIERQGNVINLPDLFDLAIGSIINNFLFGYHLEGEKEAEFWEIKHMMDDYVNEYGGHSLFWMYMFWPNLLKNMPWFKQKKQVLDFRIDSFHVYFERRILERQKEVDLSDLESPPLDYVEAFLKERARREAKGESEEEHHFTMMQLGMMCFDLWISGQETTATMLTWGLALLLNNQASVQKMQREMDQLVGDRMVTVADRAKLPFTNAVINEILRVANIAPQNFLRKVGKDLTLDGFTIKKGTCILPQISVVLCDENIFPEPARFLPERFIDSEGKLKRCEQLIPFSIGKRQCLGESLARLEMFLFIANIFNRYQVVAWKELPSLKRNPGAVVHCSPFVCEMKKRQN